MPEILIVIGIVVIVLFLFLLRTRKPKVKKMTEEEIKNWKCPWNICG